MRYYQIRRGKEDIFGSVIQVNSEGFLLEEIVKKFMGNMELELIKATKDAIYYRCNLNEVDESPTTIGISVKKKKYIALHLGDLKNIEIYLRGITKEEAEELKENLHKWRLYQDQDMS